MTGTITLPVWLVPVIVTLGLATITALWRTAEALTDATRRLLAMESRIAVVAVLETSTALLRAQLDEARTAIESLRASRHAQASELATLRAQHEALTARVGHLADDLRASQHPSSPR